MNIKQLQPVFQYIIFLISYMYLYCTCFYLLFVKTFLHLLIKYIDGYIYVLYGYENLNTWTKENLSQKWVENFFLRITLNSKRGGITFEICSKVSFVFFVDIGHFQSLMRSMYSSEWPYCTAIPCYTNINLNCILRNNSFTNLNLCR